MTKIDLYQQVTDTIIAQIEQGTLPWLRPWKSTAPVASSLPYNAASKRTYSGVNILTLWASAAAQGFTSSGWMTFKQADALGAHVRKGSKGTQIIFVSTVEKQDKNTGEDVRIPILRNYTVFNTDQIEGLPAQAPAPVLSPAERHAAADAFIAATGAVIRHGGNDAFYSPLGDSITLPVIEAFDTPAHYYATAAHELIHWTGAKHRLDRVFGKRFGDGAYAAEELVAEMGAAFVCAALGIEGNLRHADYVANWLKVLKADKRAIFTAASAASKAADFLAAFSGAEQADEEEALAA